MEILKVLAPYFTSILGAIVAIGIAIYNNSSKTKAIQNKLSEVDQDLQTLKKNHFFHLGEYLKKLNAFLQRGKLMDEVERVGMDSLADGVAGKR
ncbi:MAG: hypothetical protein LBH44_03250 [Treponema sp.]|nr:hypothetical protein [Treponema sp.]